MRVSGGMMAEEKKPRPENGVVCTEIMRKTSHGHTRSHLSEHFEPVPTQPEILSP